MENWFVDSIESIFVRLNLLFVCHVHTHQISQEGSVLNAKTAPECKWNDVTFVIAVEKAHFVLIIRKCIQIAPKHFSNRIKKQNK